MENIVIIGGGGHAISLMDSIVGKKEYNIIGYTDFSPSNNYHKYLGTDKVLMSLFQQGTKYAAVGVGYLRQTNIRDKIYGMLKQIGYILPTIIDKSAVIAQDTIIGEGTFIGKGVVVNADTKIGCMCIINTHATVEHGNMIGDFVHVSVGASLCGNVTVEDHCLIGANSTIIQGIRIGCNTIIGAGSVVLTNVSLNQTCYGIVK